MVASLFEVGPIAISSGWVRLSFFVFILTGWLVRNSTLIQKANRTKVIKDFLASIFSSFTETLLSFGEILDRKKPFIVNLHYARTPRALALERDPTSLFKVSLKRDATNLR